MQRTSIVLVLVLVSLLLVLGCDSQQKTEEPVLIVDPIPLVKISGTRFEPEQLVVSVGDTVEFRNATLSEHTVTTDPGMAVDPQNVRLPAGARSFHSGTLKPGKSYFHTFSVPGQYGYISVAHEHRGMVGRVLVMERAAPTPTPDDDAQASTQ